jgi:hypothetical protein
MTNSKESTVVTSTAATTTPKSFDHSGTTDSSITVPTVEKVVATNSPKAPTVITTTVLDEPMSEVTTVSVKEGPNVAVASIETVVDNKNDFVANAISDQKDTSASKGDISANLPVKQKKKKKNGYKNMMASMMHQTPTRDVKKEADDAIRKVTGGGTFTKIDKI